MQIDNNDGASDGARHRTVANPHFFRARYDKGSVIYLLNEGYCNVRCQHCYINRVKAIPLRRNPEHAEGDIGCLREQGYKVQLRGTELIIHDEFIPLFHAAGQDYVQTNGVHVVEHPEVLSRLSSVGIRYVVVSYPFDPEGMVGVDASISDEAISLCAKQFGVTVSAIITRNVVANLESLGNFCEHVRALGARAVKFIRLMPVSPDLVAFTPTPEEAKDALLEIARLKRKYHTNDLLIQTPGCFGMFDFRRSLAPERFASVDLSSVYDCPAGMKNFVIDVNNSVFPCLYLMEPGQRIGRYQNGKLLMDSAALLPGGLRKSECPAYTRHFTSWISVPPLDMSHASEGI